jgi:hypothetical protein
MSNLSSHPLNLAVRFLLELGALAAFGYWGLQLVDGPARFVFMLAIPLVLAVAWGVFGVRGDTRGGGKAPVYVRGWVRLVLELAVLFGAGLALALAGQLAWGLGFAVVVLVQNLVGFDRVRWLLAH